MKPLGTMANKELRVWRIRTHAKIDPIWKSGEISRSQVYGILSRQLGYDVHVGSSNIEECKRIIEVADNLIHLST